MTTLATLNDKNKFYLFSQSLMLIALFGLIYVGLLPAFFGGMLVYFLVEFGSKQLEKIGILPDKAKLILLFFIAVSLISLLAVGIFAITASLSRGPESLVALLQRMADVVDKARNYLPLWGQDYLPANMDDWQKISADWLREHAGHFSAIGREAGAVLFHIVFGIVIGGMVALSKPRKFGAPLAYALHQRIVFLGTSFRRVFFSQVKISALNSTLTGIFLLFVLPFFGYNLPLTKTMIAFTFIVGLLPIVGNLMSNTVIFFIALSVSPFAAIAAITFLIVIHKLEFFINAHIIGTEIKAKAWEILLAMLIMESIFGLAGLVAAPIFYAYIKDELTAQKLV